MDGLGVLMSAFVRMFNPQFARLVESGLKRQTVRSTPKRMPKCGDVISLREWCGKPYRSKQRVLKEILVDRVQSIRITTGRIELDGQPLSGHEADSFAKADGFIGKNDLIGWFNCMYGLPFLGIVIYW